MKSKEINAGFSRLTFLVSIGLKDHASFLAKQELFEQGFKANRHKVSVKRKIL